MGSRNPILSIVVPVFNVEKYLHKCVDSLLCQDLGEDEYEIILIDDGSSDNSGKIADEYAEYHHNITTIHQENGGLSVARNTGINSAQGEYIQFVDSDDYLEPNVLGNLLRRVIKDNLDVLRFNFQNVNEDYIVFEPNKESRPFMDYADTICSGLEFLNERLGYACYACQFIIKTSLIKDCYFKEHIIFEDSQWTPRMLRKASRVSSTSEIIYYYLFRSGSITNTANIDKLKNTIDSKLLLIADLQIQMDSCSDKRWYEGMISSTVISIISILSEAMYKDRHKYLKQLYDLEVFPISKYHLSITGIRKARLINFSPNLTCNLLHLKNRL